MASIATVLFLASFTQQRRRHGRSSNAPVGESDTHPPAPEGTASISQQLFFSWMDPMIWLGYKRPLEPKDVYDLMPEDRSMRVCAKWQRESRDYVRKHGSDKRGMTYRLFWFFRYQLALQCVWTLVFTVFIFTGPFLLKRILAYMEDQTIYTREQAFWCVAGLLLGGTISTVCQSQALWIGRKIGLQIKAIVIGEVYKKSLRRRDAASEDDAPAKDGEGDDNSVEDADKQGESTSTGKITNLMAVDANKISEASSYLHFLYQLPAEIVITVLMLYQLLGLASIAGLCTLLLLVPFQWRIVSVWSKLQTQLMKASDKRMSMTNEILQGVRIIKFFAWEPQFEKQVAAIRSGELGVLRKRYLLLTVSIVIFFMAPVFITLTTFVVYTKVMDKQLTASIAFTALALFKTLRGPMDQLPDFFSFCLQAKVSVDRVSKFLSEEETSKYELSNATDIGFIDASFSWKSAASASASAEIDLTNPTLRDLTVSFPVGKLSIIAGPTGCGKTSLLMALLGEMRLTAGRLMVPGAAFSARATFGENMSNPFSLQESVAYVAQQAWLLNDTIRGNITFGLPYDEQRYREVVHMCALTRDFEIIDAGDMTEVGERGVALSGGQKQRICLARAVYSPARHVIMDDCLSAVDAHTAKHLYDNCLMAPLMSERTRILVTHAVGLAIKSAAMVVVMQDGRIAAAGTPLEVLHSGKLSEETLREADEEQQNAATRAEARSASARVKASAAPQDANAQKGKLTTDEGWSRGHVQWRVYLAYFRASGGLVFWAILTVLFMLTQGLLVAQDWWLREWAASYSKSSLTSYHFVARTGADHRTIASLPTHSGSVISVEPLSVSSLASGLLNRSIQFVGLKGEDGLDGGRVDLAYFIGVYVAIALASVFLILGRSLLQFWGSLKASRTLHESLLHTVLRAPVRFFDTTPVGRLINRFSKDMETIDQSLNSSLAIFLTEVIASLAILIVIAVITPAFTLGAIVVAIIYWIIGVLYLATSREIKRFESVTKSPIYTQFDETINGVSTIRAYGQESRFRMANYTKVDDNNRPFIYMWGANRWLSIRVDLAGALVSFMAGLLALTTTGRMDAGLAGLSLSYALNFTEHILWVVRFYSINEMNLNSVERVVEYLDVEPEAPVTIPDRVPPVEWPSNGRISVENLELKYAENQPPVIRGISFEVQPREKVGIVGRTGAGKSTLTLAMFRFMEASAGRIMVDGIDISQIGVGDLRSRLTIIPQDPILFTGTIRSNLDPFNEHGDDELWLALRRAHLLGDEDEIASRQSQTAVTLGRTITDLDMAVTENGSNFSQGQRQLIALARALVKRTRVIILDEATASVDFDTDARIQTTIRNEFTDSTLLCIAHRLRTIVDYDKVLVLDQGEIVEYDTPYNLLSKSEGLFKHMCLKSGEYDHLFSAAERKHHSGTNEAIISA
ncbi:P-loop containing nucleoside triphosphate hydrolase protein [Kickxella alabastrina]|uniref:P-loop containing nucleoside triphosphate hydrolase protein n=1 Tax=Kickxella alabastrina TaxID=61397 RepID=UPI002220A4AD|nr:P-loop containing nucleoside triphosphate hydrolase protein [Kickxella alabastrina]KAI7834991.1 P-loop containing nucleoside triphosphate hydrolase protein [Kickxella alabastrina]